MWLTAFEEIRAVIVSRFTPRYLEVLKLVPDPHFHLALLQAATERPHLLEKTLELIAPVQIAKGIVAAADDATMLDYGAAFETALTQFGGISLADGAVRELRTGIEFILGNGLSSLFERTARLRVAMDSWHSPRSQIAARQPPRRVCSNSSTCRSMNSSS